MKLRWLLPAGVFLFVVTDLPAAKQPHILYINADDLGVMDVGYNNAKFNTPNIDQLTKDGMVFTNAYAPSANCAPSRACVHSGQWSARHGVYTVGNSDRGKAKTRKLIPVKNRHLLPEDTFTMAIALKAAGYKTIHLGKYHIGKDPLTQGYDVNIGGGVSGGPSGGGYFSPWKTKEMQHFSDKYPKGTHRMDVFADQAIKFIDANKDTPMFIHFSPYSVHTALEPVPEFIGKYKNKDINAKYASMVEKLDQGIGLVLAHLEKAGIADNTLVVFCSDNGGIRAISTQAPHRAGKGSYYEGGIREPLVMRWKGKIKPGTTCDTPVCSLDFFPTFISVAGAGSRKHLTLDGVDISPLMRQTGTIPERALYWHFPIYLQAYSQKHDDGRDPLFRTRPGSAMRFGKWKLHEYFEDGGIELYDLEKDPGERKNLATQMPEKTIELKKMLYQWRTRIQAPVPTEKNPHYDPSFHRNRK